MTALWSRCTSSGLPRRTTQLPRPRGMTSYPWRRLTTTLPDSRSCTRTLSVRSRFRPRLSNVGIVSPTLDTRTLLCHRTRFSSSTDTCNSRAHHLPAPVKALRIPRTRGRPVTNRSTQSHRGVSGTQRTVLFSSDPLTQRRRCSSRYGTPCPFPRGRRVRRDPAPPLRAVDRAGGARRVPVALHRRRRGRRRGQTRAPGRGRQGRLLLPQRPGHTSGVGGAGERHGALVPGAPVPVPVPVREAVA